MAVHPFPIDQLIWPTIAIMFVGFLLSVWFTRRVGLSCWVAALKAGLFLVYFGFIFDGTYTFLDDWRYLRLGKKLVSDGIGIFNLIHNYDYVRSTVESSNLFYYVYNATALVTFGRHYFAPVAANILLTFVAAGMLMKAARMGLGMSRNTSVGLFVFLALSPTMLAWSTLANLKDILVAMGTAGVVYAVALVEAGKAKRAVPITIGFGLVLLATRFYVPLMLGAAFGITLIVSHRGRRSPWLWLAAIVALVVVVYGLDQGSLGSAYHEFRSRLGNPVTGIVRFIATPIPFHTEPQYAFLDLPQLFFWILLPLEFYGLLAVWRTRKMTARYMVIYFVMLTLLYGMFPTLQGPRHRVQLDGLIVVFQYYGILALVRQRFRFRRRPRFAPARPPPIRTDEIMHEGLSRQPGRSV
ncbi:MAG TPA: hypothetical protein VFP92_06530 [Rhodanobacteraceae bacterium]|nr:hypothetical protein [Rhodanobacteraceae bacterium]